MYLRFVLTIIFFSSGAALAADTTLKVLFSTQTDMSYDLFERFSQQTDIDIDGKWVDQSGIRFEILEFISQKNAPDAVIIPADHVGMYDMMNYSVIDPSDAVHDIDQQVWLGGYSDHAIYGAPLYRGNYLSMFYNKSLVAEPAQTWEELKRQYFQRRAAGNADAIIAWSYHEMYWFVPFLGSFGGWPIDQGQITLDTTEMAEALQYYYELSQVGFLADFCDYACGFEAFKNGELAYTMNGDWAASEFHQALGDDLGVSLLPRREAHELTPMYSTYVIAFPSDSLNGPKRQALLKLMNFLQSPATQIYLWQQYDRLPVESTAFEFAMSHTDDYSKDLIAQLNLARAMPTESQMSIVWGAMEKGFSRFFNGGTNASGAARLMQTLADRQLERQR